jgi:hypothetical protein
LSVHIGWFEIIPKLKSHSKSISNLEYILYTQSYLDLVRHKLA